VLDDAELKVLLRLLTLATEARTVVAGRLAAASGGNDVGFRNQPATLWAIRAGPGSTPGWPCGCAAGSSGTRLSTMPK
jgi:hypothetical protein